MAGEDDCCKLGEAVGANDVVCVTAGSEAMVLVFGGRGLGEVG